MRDTVGAILEQIYDLTGLSVSRKEFGPKIEEIVSDLGRNPSRVGDRILEVAGDEISIIRTDGGFLIAHNVRFVET